MPANHKNNIKIFLSCLNRPDKEFHNLNVFKLNFDYCQYPEDFRHIKLFIVLLL